VPEHHRVRTLAPTMPDRPVAFIYFRPTTLACVPSYLPVARPTSSVEFDDVGEPCQPSRLQLLRQLGHDVEPGRGGGLPQSPRQLEFDLVFGAAWALLISPRLPHAGVNTPDLGSPRIVDRACFL